MNSAGPQGVETAAFILKAKMFLPIASETIIASKLFVPSWLV